MNNEWFDIPGYECLYKINRSGEIKSIYKYREDKILKNKDGKDNYKIIGLSKNGKVKTYYVHRLVAITFIDNPMKLDQVNHIDGNKLNNNALNLEWCTSKENLLHSYKLGLKELKPVAQIEQGTHRILNTFQSTREAGRIMNVSNSSISSACKKRHCCKGFIWKYI